MLALALALLLAAGEGDLDSVVGTVKLTRGGASGPLVHVASDADRVRVEGELKGEVARLQSAKVELLGRRAGDLFHVTDYRILDIGGGIRPVVGLLVERSGGFGLRDGDGEAIPLSMNPRGKRRLQDKAGAKIWVSGKMLPSGELKVLRYGVLREPVPLPKPAD